MLVDARRCSPVPALFKAFSTLQVSCSLGRGTLAALLSRLDVTSPSAAYVSICHLAFILLWEVEICTQPCFRRMTWTCQTADKAKNLSKSELGENTPPHPSKFPFISVLRTAHTHISMLSWIILLGGAVPCTEGLCEMVRDFCLPQRRKEERPLPGVRAREGHCLPCQVEKHMQLLMWLSVND